MENKTKTIFLVDDNITNLKVGSDALEKNYDVLTLNSGARLLKALERTIPNLILLDVDMPDMNGYEVIKLLKADPLYESIPVIFLTAMDDEDSEIEGLSLGAIDYITKPFKPHLLRKRIEVHLLVEDQNKELKHLNNNLQSMVTAKTETVVELKNTVLKTLGELVEYRDDTTGKHIERTQGYLKLMINTLIRQGLYADEISTWDLELVLQSAQLHDLGKIAIKDNILLKPGMLTPDEFEEIKNHALVGVQIIEKIKESTKEQAFLEYASVFAGTHHEKWDGSGYPNGLSGEDIPLLGRLMAIADVYDALLSERPYKNAFSHADAVEIIKEGRGTHFDPTITDIFLMVEHEFEKIVDTR